MNLDYGYARKGQKVYDEKPLHPGESINTIAVLTTEGIKGQFSFQGTLDAILFVAYLDTYILPLLTAQHTLIMDNSPIHHAKIVQQYIQDNHIKVLFLPAYSPELNPIELAFSKIKHALKSDKPRTISRLVDAIKAACQSISSDQAINYFNHAFSFNNLLPIL